MLVATGIAHADGLFQPEQASLDLLMEVHEPSYLQAFFAGTLSPRALKVTGLDWSENLVRRTRLEVGGTVLATQLALRYGLACQTAGGTHHAFPDWGSGYCALNDLAVASRWALQQPNIDKVLILDLDVHQGDGTAFIFADEPRVFTCSFHCQKNFPARKQTSDLDVGFERGVGDSEYLAKLREVLPHLLKQEKPDLVLYDAGVDVHQADRLGHLALTDTGLRARDRYVIETVVEAHIPLACVIGGGYARDVGDLAYRHSQLHRAAHEVWARMAH